MLNPILLLEKVLKALFALFDKAPPNHALTASFGKQHELLSKKFIGFSVNGKHQLSESYSFQNLLIVGATGSGKTSSCLIPSILKMEGSMVIHDPSGELYLKTSGALQRRGYTLKVFNPADPGHSDGFNVFEYVKDHSDLHKIARSLVVTNRQVGMSEPIWDELATSLISLLLRGLFQKPKEFQNLPNVYHLLNEVAIAPERLNPFFETTGYRGLVQEYQAFCRYEEKLRTSVNATAKGALHYLADENLCRVLIRDSLEIHKMRRELMAIFIQNKIGEGEYYKPLTSLFFEMLFAQLFRMLPEVGDKNVYLLLDEASSLVCPTLPLAIANLRKYRVGMLLALQDYSQLIATYGDKNAETIRSNCFGKLYFSGGSLQSCSEISQTLGSYSYTDSDGIKRTRPLLTADEIRMIQPSEAIFIAGSRRPLFLNLYPYYSQKTLQKLSLLPSVQRGIKDSKEVAYYPLAIDQSYASP